MYFLRIWDSEARVGEEDSTEEGAEVGAGAEELRGAGGAEGAEGAEEGGAGEIEGAQAEGREEGSKGGDMQAKEEEGCAAEKGVEVPGEVQGRSECCRTIFEYSGTGSQLDPCVVLTF
jgi:hypothetical protein